MPIRSIYRRIAPCALLAALCAIVPLRVQAAPSDSVVGPSPGIGAKNEDAFTTGLPASSVVSLLKALYNLQKSGGGGAAFATTQLPALLDPNGFLKVHEQGAAQVAGSIVSAVDNFNARPSNTTAYAAGQVWSPNLTITGITNASPPVVTCGTNTLVAGQYVTIAGVVGATGANGTWRLGTTTGTTITLLNSDGTNPSAPGVWSSGGTVAQLLVFHLGRVGSATGYITKAEINVGSTTTTNGAFRIHLYNSPVTALVDQAGWTTLAANFSKRVGYIDWPTVAVETASGSDSAFAQATALGLPYTTDAQGNIYGVVVAEQAYPPTSAETLSVKLSADQN